MGTIQERMIYDALYIRNQARSLISAARYIRNFPYPNQRESQRVASIEGHEEHGFSVIMVLPF